MELGRLEKWLKNLERRDKEFWTSLGLNVTSARFCVKLFIASTISLLLVFIPATRHFFKKPAWIFATVQVVAQTTIGDSSSKGFNRVLGTAVAAGISAGFVYFFPKINAYSPYGISVVMLPLLMAAAYLQFVKELKQISYAFLMFRVTLGLIAIPDYLDGEDETVALHRILNIFVGCLLWLVIERLYFFGSYASSELVDLMGGTLVKLAELTRSICESHQKELRAIIGDNSLDVLFEEDMIAKYNAISFSRKQANTHAASIEWEIRLLRRMDTRGKIYYPLGRCNGKLYAEVLNEIRRCAFAVTMMSNLFRESFDVIGWTLYSEHTMQSIFSALGRLADVYDEMAQCLLSRNIVNAADTCKKIDDIERQMSEQVRQTCTELLKASTMIKQLHSGKKMSEPDGENDSSLAELASLTGARRHIQQLCDLSYDLLDAISRAQQGNSDDFAMPYRRLDDTSEVEA